MKFWDYIAGFYLLRRLFGSNKNNDSGCDDPGSPGTHTYDDITDVPDPDLDGGWRHNGYYGNYDYGDSLYNNDFLDNSDDFLGDPDDFIDDDF